MLVVFSLIEEVTACTQDHIPHIKQDGTLMEDREQRRIFCCHELIILPIQLHSHSSREGSETTPQNSLPS